MAVSMDDCTCNWEFYPKHGFERIGEGTDGVQHQWRRIHVYENLKENTILHDKFDKKQYLSSINSKQIAPQK
jgi:hypothetical protein